MDRIKCAYVKLSKEDSEADVTEVEQALNCKVLHGLGVEDDWSHPFHNAIDIVVPAYFGVFTRSNKPVGGSIIDEFPDLLIFSDSINELMFDLKYGPADAKFSITPQSLREMERLMWAVSDAEKLLGATENLKENLDDFKAGGIQLHDFSTDLNAWSDSIELHMQDVRRVLELRAHSMVAMFKTGWQ